MFRRGDPWEAMLPGFTPVVMPGGGPLEGPTDQGDHQASLSASATGTFSSVDLGAAHAFRRIFVVLTYRFNTTVSSLVIAGRTATQRAAVLFTTPTPDLAVEIWEAIVDDAITSGDVVVTFAASQTGVCEITAYRTVNCVNPAADSDTATGTSGVTALETTVDVPVGGAVIAGHARGNSAQSLTWTNATENSDLAVSTTYRHSAASAAIPAGAAGRVITGTGSSNGECAQVALAIG